MTDRVEIERRCGMIMGARHGHMTLTWLPDRGRHGTRTWVLSTHVRGHGPPHPAERQRTGRTGGHIAGDSERRRTALIYDITPITFNQLDLLSAGHPQD